MAKLSHDTSSWRAHGLIKRYTEHDDEAPAKKPKNTKKNTKLWCRGVEGHPHDIRSVVIGRSGCYRSVQGCTQNPDFTGKQCNHWRSITKCIKCHVKVTGWGWRNKKNPTKTNKKPNGVITEQQILAEKWCTEGHLWDWTDFTQKSTDWVPYGGYFRYGHNIDMYVVVKGEIMIKNKDHEGNTRYTKPYRMPRVHKYCVMCGLERNSQSREITPEDLK